MIPRISVVPKISIRKKLLAISGMIKRIAATIQAAGFSNSGHTLAVKGGAAATGSCCASSWADWVSDMSSPRQQALGPQSQHHNHYEKSHGDRVGRDVDRAQLLGEADD